MNEFLGQKLPAPNGDPHQLHKFLSRGFTPADWHFPAWPEMPQPPRYEHPCPRCGRPAAWFKLGQGDSVDAFQAYCKRHCEPDFRYFWVNRQMRTLGICDAYVRGMAFDQFIPADMRQGDAFAKVREFCAKPGRWLVLSGASGTGKTHLAVAAIRAHLEIIAGRAAWEYQSLPQFHPLRLPMDIEGAGANIRFTRGSEVFADLQTGYKANRGEMDAALRSPALLVIDDFDADFSKAENKILENAMDARYAEKRSTMFTTNLNRTEFFTAIGSRTVSRLQELGEVISMEGVDFRRKRTQEASA